MKKIFLGLLIFGSISAFAQSSTEKTQCFKVDRLIYNAIENNYEVRDNSMENYTFINADEKIVLEMAKIAISSDKKLCLTMDVMVSDKWIRAEIK